MKTLARLDSIGDLGGIDRTLTEEVAEAGRRAQVDVAPEELAELALQIDELKEAEIDQGAREGPTSEEQVTISSAQ